jgi:hypothetical protein
VQNAIIAVAGIVTAHVKNILCIVGQCTPKESRVKPTPEIDPVTVCVVEIGTP